MDFRPSTCFTISILRSLDPWGWISEDLETRRGILLQLEEIDM
jgi:hypothetical protein